MRFQFYLIMPLLLLTFLPGSTSLFFIPKIYAQNDSLGTLRLKAEHGDSDSQFDLASMYYKGEGVFQDSQEAFKWYKKAAEQGHTSAASNLGLMYYKGKGIPYRDYKEAFKWYKKAAELGSVDAQDKLCIMYYKGRGVSQDYVKSYAWYKLAAAQGTKNKYRDKIIESMAPEQIVDGQELAARLHEKIESSK